MENVESLDFCLRCERKGVPLHSGRHWNLCVDCYPEVWGKGVDCWESICHQKQYFKHFEKYGKLKNSANKKNDFIALWYSVSPPRGDPYKIEEGLKFIKKIKKFVTSKSIKKAVLQFEWKYKGGPLDFYGIHCHMLLWGERKKINWHISRQKERYFNLNDKQKFYIYDSELIDDKISYFTGGTLSDEKNKEKEWDKQTRVKHGLSESHISVENVTLCP